MGNFRQFTIELKKFGAAQPKIISAVMRRSALVITSDLIQGSPVDTGRFRASWVASVGVANRYVPPEGNYATTPPTTILAEMTPATVDGSQPIIISNNLPYGPSLADGSSQQAPRGWIDAAVARAQREIDVVKWI